MSTVSRVLAVALIALALSGCGKKGSPQPPPGAVVTYPQQQYPSQ